ncbi:tRNA uridine-5-carboxymethylaminomethyl(34) synthesis GTPase MnmE [Haploplasma modicum]|jgi:tRNA modification GTPase|uniref:tRNA uridine-5-carboxymethylaminomethyl(34) synthesis GTPase MnmE n=1 Tax=Haploplasma modicum TaxID=2150 RepID=UPI00047AD3FF|nr:tRNA uridine-5-carboxymethylaminomethyl(34) synthesis GTPase MnmE [Haploplasma modicum]MCR1809345.1 tRNA uridine-5-carboxymethylaminomethyl(34) synthesis GTPase MnmE [Haploplasma modicum]
MFEDTICAIATPHGTGGISVIRVSGTNAIDIVNKIFKGKNLKKAKSHTISYGHIVNEKEVIDEVLVSVFIAPKSFTGENTIEISTHGGILVTERVLEEVLAAGARLARPGEFSERAYLNGRIDLVQAESIMDIIHAKSEKALKIANLGLSRETSKLVNNLRDKLINIIANIEVNIDYPEYDQAEVITNEIVMPKTKELIKDMEYLLKKSYQTRIIREGIKTAIVGKPNVGKSSLLNTLIDEDKAIVTNIAGTTRDTIDAFINLGGITLNLIDTAGIRETSDIVEQIGVVRSKKAISEAELVLLVLDQSRELENEDKELLELTKNKNRIVILNKSDLESKFEIKDSLSISTLNKEGINVLEDEILKKLKLDNLNDDDFNYLSNVRHINKVKEAKKALEDVLVSIDNLMPVDIIVVDLTEAWNILGEIIGSRYEGELLDQLFSKFCLGK